MPLWKGLPTSIISLFFVGRLMCSFRFYDVHFYCKEGKSEFVRLSKPLSSHSTFTKKMNLFPSCVKEDHSKGVVIRAHETEAVHNFVIQKKNTIQLFQHNFLSIFRFLHWLAFPRCRGRHVGLPLRCCDNAFKYDCG